MVMTVRTLSDIAEDENILPELDGPSIYAPLFALQCNVADRYQSGKQAWVHIRM